MSESTGPAFHGLLDEVLVRPWHPCVPASAGGQTGAATAAKGREVTEAAATGLADLLVELSAAPWDERFPYA